MGKKHFFDLQQTSKASANETLGGAIAKLDPMTCHKLINV